MFESEQRPLIVALAGPNGAGKSTFYTRFIQQTGLPFINADVLAAERELGAYEAAEMAEQFRINMVSRRENFVFETVLSDPVGAKVNFLLRAAAEGYNAVLCFIGLDSAERSDERVTLRVTRGGHDVPKEKIMSRYARTLENLARALKKLPRVLVYDNSNPAYPYRFVAEYRDGTARRVGDEQPTWFAAVVKSAEI